MSLQAAGRILLAAGEVFHNRVGATLLLGSTGNSD